MKPSLPPNRFHIRAITRRWWWVFLLGVPLILAMVSVKPHWFGTRGALYESKMEVHLPLEYFGCFGGSYEQPLLTDEHMQSRFDWMLSDQSFEIVLSETLVAKRLGTTKQAQLKRLRQDLSLDRKQGTDHFFITCRDEDPVLARDLCGALLTAYLDRSEQENKQRKIRLIEEVKTQIAARKKPLALLKKQMQQQVEHYQIEGIVLDEEGKRLLYPNEFEKEVLRQNESLARSIFEAEKQCETQLEKLGALLAQNNSISDETLLNGDFADLQKAMLLEKIKKLKAKIKKNEVEIAAMKKQFRLYVQLGVQSSPPQTKLFSTYRKFHQLTTAQWQDEIKRDIEKTHLILTLRPKSEIIQPAVRASAPVVFFSSPWIAPIALLTSVILMFLTEAIAPRAKTAPTRTSHNA